VDPCKANLVWRKIDVDQCDETANTLIFSNISKENPLELWKDLFTDPVAIYSAIGFIIMLGIGGFFLWFFLTKSAPPKK
jgi:hypothetical protein